MPGMFGGLIGPGAAKRPVGGIPDFLEQGADPLVQMPQQTAQPRQGGGGKHVLGIIADALAGAAGQPGMYAQNNYARQREERRRAEIEEQYERQRQDSWADFVRRAQYERENPRPVNNDTVADFNFIAERLGPEAAQSFLTNKTLPPPFVQKNPDGTSTIYPQGIPRGGAPSSPTPGTVEDGFRFKGGNPADKNNWEPVGAGGAGFGSPTFP